MAAHSGSWTALARNSPSISGGNWLRRWNLFGNHLSILGVVVVESLKDMFLTFFASLTILGPGALAPASPGILERVEMNRLSYHWGLDIPAPATHMRIAVADCDLLGYQGLAFVEDEYFAIPIYVVDCEAEEDAGQLAAHKLVADINWPELGHRQAILLLWNSNRESNGPYVPRGEK